MRKVIAAAMIPCMAILLAAACLNASDDSGEEAVRRTIENAYVKGIHIERDVPAIRKGFHPQFKMFIRKDGDVSIYPLKDWIEAIEKRKEESPEPPAYETTWKIPMVDITGEAAVAKVEIYRDGKHIYTDYMSLYRFEDGWKIVGKIYHSH